MTYAPRTQASTLRSGPACVAAGSSSPYTGLRFGVRDELANLGRQLQLTLRAEIGPQVLRAVDGGVVFGVAVLDSPQFTARYHTSNVYEGLAGSS